MSDAAVRDFAAFGDRGIGIDLLPDGGEHRVAPSAQRHGGRGRRAAFGQEVRRREERTRAAQGQIQIDAVGRRYLRQKAVQSALACDDVAHRVGDQGLAIADAGLRMERRDAADYGGGDIDLIAIPRSVVAPVAFGALRPDVSQRQERCILPGTGDAMQSASDAGATKGDGTTRRQR